MEKRPSRLYAWAIQKASSPRAPLWIGLLFFFELVLFVPLDTILLFFCLQNRPRIFLYVGIAAIASLASGVIGYLVGHFLWDLLGGYIIPYLISASQFDRISTHFQAYENWAVFFGSFFPFPLKAISLTAGVFHLGIIPFVVCLASARFLRFFLIGSAMAFWGERVKDFVERHFHRILMLVGAKVAVALFFFWILAR